MALNDIETARIKRQLEAFIKTRQSASPRPGRIDLSYEINGQAVLLFANRHRRDGSEYREYVGKTTYVKTRSEWKVYWMRADLKWHLYHPTPAVTDIESWLAVLEQDPHGCFWG